MMLAAALAMAMAMPAATEARMTMKVTGYCVCKKCCGPNARGITASGAVARGKMIAAPPRFPFGTMITVPGYGRAVVTDRGSAIQGNHIDLLFPTHQQAKAWGVRTLTVTVSPPAKRPG